MEMPAECLLRHRHRQSYHAGWARATRSECPALRLGATSRKCRLKRVVSRGREQIRDFVVDQGPLVFGQITPVVLPLEARQQQLRIGAPGAPGAIPEGAPLTLV